MPKMICVPLPCKFPLVSSFLVKLVLKISMFISENTRGRCSWQETGSSTFFFQILNVQGQVEKV